MSRTPLAYPPPRHAAPEPASAAELPYAIEDRPARRRWRWLTAVAYLLLAIAVLLLGQFVRGDRDGRSGDRIVVPETPPASAAPVPKARHAAASPTAGTSGRFRYTPGFGPVLGSAGPIRRFRVAVELPAGPDQAAAFADEVNRVLGDRRSWIAGRRFRLQRVPQSAPAEFTLYLASARTSERMCRAGGLETGGYTSCRLPRRVILNGDRWEGAVLGYGAPLATYRAYVINHETGHQFGYGHERCPGKGRPAPVMMQQTYGLGVCFANSWPYPGGRLYAGPPAR